MTMSAQALVEQASGIYALPEIYAQLNRKLADPHASNPQIADVVQLDAGLSSSLLKIVNSAFYGFPSTISTISQAISIIGRNELAELVLGKSVISVFNQLAVKPEILQTHWRRSLLCGLLSKQLGKQIPGCEASPDSLFVAGLLHDIGKLVIWHEVPDLSNELLELELEPDESKSYLLKEREQLGFDHTLVGALLLESWKLPELLVTTTRFYATPEVAESHQQATSIVSLAAEIALFEPEQQDNIASLADMPVSNSLSLHSTTLLEAVAVSHDQLTELQAIFLGS